MKVCNGQNVTWGSHVPLHRAIYAALPVTGTVELGIGLYSTKMFFNLGGEVVGVETDAQWIDKVREEVQEDETHYLVHHEAPKGVVRHTRPWTLSDEQLREAGEFMASCKRENTNHLFIDSISAFRYEALVNCAPAYDIVTFHDFQDVPGRRGIVNHYRSDYKFKYDEKFVMLIDKTYPVHTGLLVRADWWEDYSMDLIKAHSFECDRYHDLEAKLERVEW